MSLALDQSQSQRQRQTLAVSPQQLQGLKLLAKSLPELRAEILAEMARNPAIEDVERPLEAQPPEDDGRQDEPEDDSEYQEYDLRRGARSDASAAERRQAFFDNQASRETLQEHLLAQLPTSGIPEADWQLAETLVGDLDDNGYYRGSVPDMAMAFGCPEAKILAVLAQIREFDPPGCGARTPRECLLAQVDDISDVAVRERVRRIVDTGLDDLAAGREEELRRSLGVGRDDFAAALAALRSLDGRPGQQYPSERDRVEYVNPEIRAVKRNGRWVAETEERSLPEIHLSKSFERLLSDPHQAAETKAYVEERIAAANAFRDSIVRRQQTIAAIAQAIFDRQQDFFEGWFRELKPLTELEVAEKVGVHGATVSRAVCNKYASTPQGTVELRRLFSTGVRRGADGDVISQQKALAALQDIVDDEDPSAPLSDERIAAKMKEAGIPIARRTVAKYRGLLGIGGVSERRALK